MTMLTTSSLAFVISAVLSVSPLALAQNFPPVVSQKIQAAKKQVKTIGMEEYRKVVENPGTGLIVDVREPNEFAAGHVPGAINIPEGSSNFKSGSRCDFRPISILTEVSSSNAKAATAPHLQPSHLLIWDSHTRLRW